MIPIFDWLFRRKRRAAPAAPAEWFVCSGCYETHRSSRMHALPWWNPDARAFFMSTRCGDCFLVALAEARGRVRAWDSEAENAFRSFLDIWKIEARMPQLAGLSPRAAAEAVLEYVEQTDGRPFATVFLGQA